MGVTVGSASVVLYKYKATRAAATEDVYTSTQPSFSAAL